MIRPATSLSQREAGKTDVHLSGVLQEGVPAEVAELADAHV
jgi:hypothetical protein